MSDPILQTLIAFGEAVMENPATASLVMGAVRSVTGYLYTIWVEKTGKPFDKRILAGTMTKYVVAINSAAQVLPLFNVDPQIASGLVILADIGFSAIRKLKNGKPKPEK